MVVIEIYYNQILLDIGIYRQCTGQSLAVHSGRLCTNVGNKLDTYIETQGLFAYYATLDRAQFGNV